MITIEYYSIKSHWEGGILMYEKAFKKLFWGYIFIFINLRISGVDILPDSIGYIIILQGIKMLFPNS